jgi:CelD/BcsL family acetyltransferase involved in cellulose biosynthesis
MLTAAPKIATKRSPITVEQIHDVASFRALRLEWEELLSASDSACVFLTWEWLFTWWKNLAEDRRLRIVAIRDGVELVALAPLALRPRDIPHARPFTFVEFLGSGFVGSDYLDVIAKKDLRKEAREALVLQLAGERLPMKWTNVRKGRSNALSILARLGEEGWTGSETTTSVCPFIPLGGMTWDSYLASLSGQHRYNFHRKWRRLNLDYNVRFEQARTEQQCREAIDVLIAQHTARWSARGGSDAFHTKELVAFHQEWTQVALKRGWLRLYMLRLNEKPAACLYGFLYWGTFYFYQSSFDAAYTESSVGMIAMGLAIRSAIEEGAYEFDLLHGDEPYKSHWSRHSRDLARLESYPPGALGGLWRTSLKIGRASRSLVRRVAGSWI